MDWQNAAEFVANYVDLELLHEPTELVRIQYTDRLTVYYFSRCECCMSLKLLS